MALYQPRHITPDVRSGIGEGTVDVTQGMTVTWEINGPSAMTAFSIVIMSNNASSTQLYTTGKITDGCPAYGTASNGAIVPFSYTISAAALTMAGITNGNEYKLLITQWWSESESVTQSSASVFITRKEPTLAITPIETRAEITDLQTTIVPVQSGTGDPYPAGGGVNKLLPMSANWTDTKNDITIAYDASTETFSLSGTNSKTDAAWLIMNSSTFTLPTVAAGETWYFSHDLPTGLYGQITYRDGNNIAKTLGSSTGDGTWKTLAVTIPNDYDHWGNVQIGVYKTAGNVTKSAIHYEFSQTSPSAWTPYSNIRPISGWTGANIYVRGKNLLEKPIGYYSDISSTLAECFFIKAGTYTFSAASVTGATSWRYGVRVKDANGNNLSDEAHKPVTTGMFWNGSAQMWISASNITSLELRLTIAEDCYIRIVFASGNTTSLTEFANAQLELGSASTAYAAYQGNTYNISWQSEAGTVYFGTFDVTLGKLTSTHAAADLGSLTWADTQVATDKSGRTVYYSSSSRIAIPTPSSQINGSISSIGVELPAYAISALEVPIFRYTVGQGSQPQLYYPQIWALFPDKARTGAEIQTLFQNQPIVLTMREPLEITLTPTEIQLLLKKNNIWSDTGAVDATVELAGHSTEYAGDIIEVFGGDTAIFTRYYTFTADYSQEQGDVLNYYRWLIANADNTDNPFFDSGNISGTMDLSCFYDGFLPQEDYAVKLMIQTENGVEATAGWDYFKCDYSPASTSGVLNAKCVGGTDAIAVSWEGIGYIPGIGTGDYSISDDNILSLPSGAFVTWRLLGTGPMSLAAPWAVLWKGTLTTENATIFTIGQGEDSIVLSYTASTGTLALTRGSTTLTSQTGAINSPTVTAILAATTLYLRVEYFGGGLNPSESLYPATTLYPVDDNNLVVNTYTKAITYTQAAITFVTLGAIQECNYVEVVNGAVSADTITAAITNGTYYPEVSESDYMMANFTQGLNAGTVDVGGDYLIGYALYRQSGTDGRLIKIADTDVATAKVYDYGATTGQGPYTYYLFPVGTNTYIAAALVSPSVMACWWNWTLMECATTEDDNIFDVVAAYRFRLNIESGAVSNNNTPSVLPNFTRYPTIQLAPQNYKTGTLTGLIGAVYWENGQPKYKDTIALQNAIYALATTHNALFLKNRKGELIRIRISGPISMQTGDNTRQQALTMTLPWVEIGSAQNVSLYSTDYAGVQEEEKECRTPLYEGEC